MNATQELIAGEADGDSNSIIGLVFNKLFSIIFNSLIGVIPLNYCVRKIIGGASRYDIAFNCALDIIALIPIFTPLVISLRVALATASRAYKVASPVLNTILGRNKAS